MRLTFSLIRTLCRVRNSINENPTRVIHIPDLVEKFGLSEYILTRGFKQCFRSSIYNYYIGVAMHWAKRTLDAGSPVKEVAHALGYNDDSNFRRAYKKVHGHYPNGRTKLQG